MTHHPDKNQGNEEIEREAHNKTLELKYAYSVLSDPAAKAQYDLLLDKHELDKRRMREAVKKVGDVRQKQAPQKKAVVKLTPEQQALQVLLKGVKDIFEELRKYNESQKKR